uniref:Uncharacterized protein n=1 Tax=Rhizophora mucronata TaxID=61149 RepID=A0A2P2PUU0_RHIMU
MLSCMFKLFNFELSDVLCFIVYLHQFLFVWIFVLLLLCITLWFQVN